MINAPTIKLATTPIINGIPNAKSPMSNITAAAVIGAASINENLAADFLSIPYPLATVIVIPDLETPGNAAAIA